MPSNELYPNIENGAIANDVRNIAFADNTRAPVNPFPGLYRALQNDLALLSNSSKPDQNSTSISLESNSAILIG
jgi:hypothetical protein